MIHKFMRIWNILLVCLTIIFLFGIAINADKENEQDIIKIDDNLAVEQVIYNTKYDLSDEPKRSLAEIKGILGIKKNNINEKIFSVAIIDSGVFPHKDLTEKRKQIIAFKDFVNHKKNPYDDSGHGTAVAGIIAGNGENEGLASFVDVVGIKVLDYKDTGSANKLLKGLKWAIDNSNKWNIKVINISIGVQTNEKQVNEMEKLCEQAYQKGILIVSAVGNNPGYNVEYFPASSKYVLAVGSVGYNEQNQMTGIENYSLEWDKNGKSCPDVYTIGSNILTLQSEVTYKGNSSENIYQADQYAIVSGTSFSAAILTGILCNLINENPEYTNEEIIQKVLKTKEKVYSDKLKLKIPVASME